VTIEDNKRVVRAFFELLSGGDVPGALAAMTDDITWWVAGKQGESPGAGTKDKRGVERMFAGMSGRFKDGMRLTFKGAIAEGDQVAIELQSFGELTNGRVYNNDYHFLVTVRDGKISGIREYLDTQHVVATFAADAG
jgi:uncharacterized protein